MPEDLVSVIRSQIETWMKELEVLHRNPRVREFTELQQKIDEADAFFDWANMPPVSTRLGSFDPYDAFEFARDLVGPEVSTLELSKLAHSRFPDMSNEGRRRMVRYLIDNGAAEIARKTVAGRPTRYKFGPFGNEGIAGRRKRLGVPDSELAALKADDLDDLVVLVPSTRP